VTQPVTQIRHLCYGEVVLRPGEVLVSVGRGPGCVGRTGWVGAALGVMSSLTTTCRIAGAQPMSAVWPVRNGEAADGAGVWLRWPDGVGPVPVESVGAGVGGTGVAVGFTDGVAAVAGLDGAVRCAVGVWIGVLVGAGDSARDDDGVPGVDPPPLPGVPTGPVVVTVAKSPCS
jgi:hypothetical protein